MLISGVTVIGSLTTPLSYFLTIRTSAACCSGPRFLCITPRPPCCASAMARRPSVTVSMAAERMGMRRLMSRVSRVARLTSRGRTSE